MSTKRIGTILALLGVLATAIVMAGCGGGDDNGGAQIQSTDDLTGKVVGAQKGTTGAAYAEDETDAKTVRTYAEIDDAFNALVAGQVDAVINDLPSSQDEIKSKKGLEIVQNIDTGENYGLAVQKDDTALLDPVNTTLAAIKDDGTYTKIYKKTFDEDPPSAILDTGNASSQKVGEPKTQESGKLIVGSDIPYPPFEEGRAPNYTGFDIDLVNEIAKRLKLDVEYQDTSFDTIFRDLAAGKFDLVASATTITPAREKTVSFTDPYYSAQQSLAVKSD
jgi:polar amino acid transport system substrate-binding protein